MSEAAATWLYNTMPVVFAAVAVSIVLYQRRAAHCDRHSRVAGSLAWLLAAVSLGISIFLGATLWLR